MGTVFTWLLGWQWGLRDSEPALRLSVSLAFPAMLIYACFGYFLVRTCRNCRPDWPGRCTVGRRCFCEWGSTHIELLCDCALFMVLHFLGALLCGRILGTA